MYSDFDDGLLRWPILSLCLRRIQPGLKDDINGLLAGVAWADHAITFAFPTSATTYRDYPSGSQPSTFSPLSAAEQALIRTALAEIAAVAGVTFTEQTGASAGTATLLFGLSNSMPPLDDGRQPAGLGYYPSSLASGGDVWFSPSIFSSNAPGSSNFKVALHEIGHSLGLKHGHSATATEPALPAEHDSHEYSLMTYRSRVGGGVNGYTNEAASFPQSLMRDDIAALQYLYGANFTAQANDTTYAFNETTGEMSINGVAQGALAGARIFRTIWDGGGNDTYDFSNFAHGARIDLRPGEGSVLDRAMLALLDTGDPSRVASGNVYNAYLYQDDARSLIENAKGGAGDDRIVGNQAANVLSGGGGNDWISGGAGNDTLFGGDGSDVLVGGDGDDQFDGGAGNDTIEGGSGSNTAHYRLARSNYQVTLNADMSLTVIGLGAASGEGADRLIGISSLAFADGLFCTSAFGWTGPRLWRGTAAADVFVGSSANDSVIGYAGADTLSGEAGDDVFEVGPGNSSINGGAGFDTAIFANNYASYSWSFSTTASQDGSILISARTSALGGSTNLSGVELLRFADRELRVFLGTAGDDSLVGTAADDLIWGAEGSDTLEGGGGDDTIFGGGGADMVRGGDGDDLIRGNSGNDTLDGGAGYNTVTYASSLQAVMVDLANGVATGQGQDSLANFSAVQGSDFSDTLIGDAASNALYGRDGDDRLKGGNGADTIDGGSGSDTAVFDGNYASY